MNIISKIVAMLNPGAHGDAGQAGGDPLAEKMRGLAWSPTEDDRSALKYQAQIAIKNKAPLAEIMATNYLGRTGDPIDY